MTSTDTTADNAVGQQNLASLKLPELRKIAADKGLKGISALRKGELITAIQTGQVPARAPKAAAEEASAPARQEQAPANRAEADDKAPAREDSRQESAESGDDADRDNTDSGSDGETRYESRSAARRARRHRARQNQRDNQGDDAQETRDDHDSDSRDRDSSDEQSRQHDDRDQRDNREDDRGQRDQREDNRGDNRGQREDDRGDNRDQRGDNRGQQRQGGGQQRDNRHDNRHDDDGQGGGRRGRRNRRNRRNRGERDHQGGQDRQGGQGGQDRQGQQNQEPEELQDVGGILEVVDNNAAFIRTTGYKASPSDVFVNNNLVRRFDLRSGDAITGQVKMNGGGQTHGRGKNSRKYNQLVRVDSVNGQHPDEARNRPAFHKLTPLYPNQRLRLETEPNVLTTRVIDLIMPIGKGQRALIVSPPKAGKTTILQNIANAIATNNPECYLMVVLVDERPEEVTDMERSVRGEVISSTFDRPPSEHTAVAELGIERAKRLVEMGQDVVVLLDSITRLGRAYNNSSPASGRILSGGVDSNALYPPKRFLGAARNIENGGSLTIIATAMVETGSAGDTVIFEEFKGTGNAELKLDRKISERRVFPAVDVSPSGTRKDELIMTPEEFRVVHKLRRILAALDPQQAIDLLIKQLKKTKSNGEFLMQVASSAPMAADKEVEDYL